MTSFPLLNKPSARSSAAGVGLMLAGVGLFALNDALGKWLVATYSVGELLLIRSFAALLLLAPFIWRAGPAAFAAAPRPLLQIARVTLSSLEVAMFFWAVSYLPLADTTTFYLAGPIYVTAMSVVLLREQVGWRRWTAVLIGFTGVVVALRPSSASFTLPALIALSGSIVYALLMIATRALRDTNDIVLMTTQFLGALAFGLATVPFGWIMPNALDLLFIGSLGVASLIALFCVVRSLKFASASVVVPYQYTLILWSVLFGWAMFGELPDIYTLTGAIIIIAAGLYIFWREHATARRAATIEAPAEIP
jgi:drug/metabolite transporter (DMT)-like permease